MEKKEREMIIDKGWKWGEMKMVTHSILGFIAA